MPPMRRSPSRADWGSRGRSRTATRIARCEVRLSASGLLLIRKHLLVLDERHARNADVVVEDRQRHGDETATLARPLDAHPGTQLEQRAVLAAHQAKAVRIEKLVALPVELHPVMRTFVDIAEDLPAPTHDDDRPRPLRAVLLDPHEMKASRPPPRNIGQPQ